MSFNPDAVHMSELQTNYDTAVTTANLIKHEAIALCNEELSKYPVGSAEYVFLTDKLTHWMSEEI